MVAVYPWISFCERLAENFEREPGGRGESVPSLWNFADWYVPQPLRDDVVHACLVTSVVNWCVILPELLQDTDVLNNSYAPLPYYCGMVLFYQPFFEARIQLTKALPCTVQFLCFAPYSG